MRNQNTQDNPIVPVLTVHVHEQPFRGGKLEILSHVRGEKQVSQVFTFESLVNCLGLTMVVGNGRYQRGNLKTISISTRNGYGRSVRAFHMDDLDTVVAVMTTRGMSLKREADKARMVPGARPQPRRDAYGYVSPIVVNGQNYFTMKSIGLAYGMAEATVRRRISLAGLDPYLVTLPGNTVKGGRPPRAASEDMLPAVEQAVLFSKRGLGPQDFASAGKEAAMVDVVLPGMPSRNAHGIEHVPTPRMDMVEHAERVATAAQMHREARAAMPDPENYDPQSIADKLPPTPEQKLEILLEERRQRLERQAEASDDDQPAPALEQSQDQLAHNPGPVDHTTVDHADQHTMQDIADALAQWKAQQD
jgi:hypothetical protein